MKEIVQKIIDLCDGHRSSKEIALHLGCSAKYVQAWMKKLDLPRRPRGGPPGIENGAFVSGRKIDRDGYVLVSLPGGHPNARNVLNRNYQIIYEHRLVMEKKIGRYLEDAEVVDHIDGCRLHNCPNNLRLFASNGDHLKLTLAGKVPRWTPEGMNHFQGKRRLPEGVQRIDSYLLRKRRGDARLQQILLAWLLLDKDSPYLLGTHGYLRKAQIDYSSRTKIKQALKKLYLQWGWDHVEL